MTTTWRTGTMLTTAMVLGVWCGCGWAMQLTHNDVPDYAPDVSAGRVVWCQFDGNDYEIMLWNGSTTRQLTNNFTEEQQPQTSNGQVVWRGYDGNDYEIFFWSAGTVRRLTDNSGDDDFPTILNGRVAWQGSDGHDYEIYYWDGGAVVQLTDNDYDDMWPRLDNGVIVWIGQVGGYYDVFRWDGTTVENLSATSDTSEFGHWAGNGVVAWYMNVPSSYNDVFRWHDGVVQRLTNDYQDDINPVCTASRVVWQHRANWSSPWHIALWDEATGLVSDLGLGWSPLMRGNLLVWQQMDAAQHDPEIVKWTGSSPVPLTSDEVVPYGVATDGTDIVWYFHDGHDDEIALLDATTVPVVESRAPAPRETGAAPGAAVTVTLNVPMDRGATEAAFSLKDRGSGQAVAGAFSWSADGKTMTFQPNRKLIPGRNYRAKVTRAALSEGQVPLAAMVAWWFSVAPRPKVVSQTPAPDATDVPVETQVIVGLNTAMDRTATERAFSLGETATAVTGSFSWANEATELTFTPDAPLAHETQYTVSIAGAKSAAGIRMRPLSWQFSTGPASPSGLTVLSGATAVPNRAGGAQVAFTLSARAVVDVEVLNLAGRPVAKAVTGRACEAGMNTVLWSGMSAAGVRVPAGTYLVRVAARTTEGAKAQALATLRIER